MKYFAVNLSLAVALSMSLGSAATINVYNTGVDDSHVILPATTVDPHYGQISPTASAFVLASPASPPWIANSSTSQWIGPDTASGSGAYTVVYRTTFDLTGLNPATAVLNGNWAVDDAGNNILINGTSTGITTSFAYNAFTPFTISSGFVSGVNTLDFQWTNTGGPGGLRVELSGTAAPISGVPETTSTVLLGTGLAALWFARRFRTA
jgi:hypothetical protein